MKDYGIKMSYQLVPDNPHMSGETPMYHYHVVLSLENRTMQLYYSVGIGHSALFTDSAPWKQLAKRDSQSAIQNVVWPIIDKYNGNPRAFPWYLNYTKSFFPAVFEYGKKFLKKLDINDVLYCLISDTQTVEYAFTFEEWADELGYDPDSRKAEQTYRVVKDQAEKFKALVGKELFEQLCEDFQDY